MRLGIGRRQCHDLLCCGHSLVGRAVQAAHV
jgi:hypothetical protein